jgi:repressor LexA
MDKLPPKQRQVLENIIRFIQENGYPPSIQQLCELCGVTSTSTIHHHLSILKKKNYIHWNSSERRAITVREDLLTKKGSVPILGVIAAGSPLQTMTDSVEYLDLSDDICQEGCYALSVKGDSMIEDHIMEGDMVLINPKARIKDGDIVVALVDGETATLKRIYREGDHVRLQPANQSMDPILVKAVEVQGKVEAIVRRVC